MVYPILPGAQLYILLWGGKMQIFRAKRGKNIFVPPPLTFVEGGGKKNVYYTQTIKN